MSGTLSAPVSLQALLARLGRIASQIDPVPELTYELAYQSFGLRRLDSELAELVADSADTGELAGVRGASDVRLLCYEAAELAIEVQVTRDKDRRSLIGEVVGAAPTDVRVETTLGIETVAVDELGRFRLNDLPQGLFRVQVTGTGSAPVITSWVTV